jgi:3-phosphoshikimate 1-carboxyvinyltransferase
MVREIVPTGPVNAEVTVPGSKSITNRALICASLAQGESLLKNASDSDDTNLMANGLNQLGILVRKSGDGLVVEGKGGRVYAPKFPIPVGNAGTTFRFLAGLAALADGSVSFEADMRMGQRPHDELFDALAQLGTKASKSGGFARYTVQGGSLNGGTARLKADRSSQFLSSLLMVAPYARNDVRIEVQGGIVSRSYVDTTIEVMRHFGVVVKRKGEGLFEARGGQRYKFGEIDIEPDVSGASYFFAAAAITGGDVSVKGVKKNSLQGDAGVLSVLETMGCTVEETAAGVRVRGPARLNGVVTDMNAMPDVVPTVAVVALFADSPTTIRNIGHLRFKESDRLEALATELQKTGARITVEQESMHIEPAGLHGAQLDTYEDHRLAMSFALVGLTVPGIKIENPECVKKSFPGFWREFEKLYKNHPRINTNVH